MKRKESPKLGVDNLDGPKPISDHMEVYAFLNLM